jgi:hypothetical protein
MNKPKIAMTPVTHKRVMRRPRSAMTALSGIVAAKKTMARS